MQKRKQYTQVNGFWVVLVSLCLAQWGMAARFEDAADSPYENRRAMENKTANNPYVLLPYKPNYAVYSYVLDPNNQAYEPVGLPPDGLDKSELEFQLSLHFPLLGNRFEKTFDMSFAFTTHAFWQAFNNNISAPFRETNYEPELIVSLRTPWTFLGLTNRSNSLILNHQSNGRYQTLSRSWNRLIAELVFEKGNYVTAFRPWYRLPEKAKTHPSDAKGDDNPDIQEYLGYFEWLNVYRVSQQTFSLRFMNNGCSDVNRSTIDISYSIPVYGRLRAYAKYFNGYGRSLIDYNVRQNAFSLGLALSDWL
ncbi:MAG: phospholipase A [Cellvibrionales bacterium]|nr:phospholipase A [Cellvibrionales bacterium]